MSSTKISLLKDLLPKILTMHGMMKFQAFRLKFDAAPRLTGNRQKPSESLHSLPRMIVIQGVQALSDLGQT